MFSNVATAIATLMIGAQASNWGYEPQNGYASYKAAPAYEVDHYYEDEPCHYDDYHYEAKPIYRAEPKVKYGYGARRSYDHLYTRRSTMSPAFLKVRRVEKVPCHEEPKSEETVMASCTFDFLGFSNSAGRIMFTQYPN